MAPSTRLQSEPERRINYAGTSDSEFEVGFQVSPEPIVSTPKRGRRPAARMNDTRASSEAPDASDKNTRKPVVRVKAGAVVKPKAGPKVRKKAPIPKKKRTTKRECLICATEKGTARSFRAPNDVCEHLQDICSLCVAKMLKTKVAERQLREAEMGCPFANCNDSLDYAALQTILSKAAFKDYDKAVTRYALSNGESYISCLSAKCGLYFSTEGCKSTKRNKQLVACPYCDYETCLKCNRPWTLHGKASCDQVKTTEDKLSEKAVKNMGAKPCPNCGMNIQKNGGCDHMTCQRCRHNFCWVCLVEYNKDFEHLDHCPHARADIAFEPGNWVPDNLTAAQINNLIAQANARLDNPVAAPAPAPVP